jgi:ABC-type multidrug transport system ATPase subunit
VTAPAIDARSLTRRFGSFTAVNAITFHVEPGEVFGFLGANGAGKTTAIRMLIGALQPTAGSATVAGYDIRTQAEQVRRRIGYMSQKFSLYPDLTVLENMVFYGKVYAVGARFAERRDEILELLSLKPYLHRRAGNLSGGWKQRLALGCALLHDPKVLFLDEPTAGIDPVARRELWDFLFLLAGRGVTLFVTTHYMDEAERCGALGYIYLSKLLVQGNPADLKLDPRVTPPGYRWLEATVEHAAELIPALNAIDGVDNVTIFGNTLHLRAADRATDGMVNDAAGPGVEFSPGAPTLEDVFVMLTKRAEAEHGIQEDRPYEGG